MEVAKKTKMSALTERRSLRSDGLLNEDGIPTLQGIENELKKILGEDISGTDNDDGEYGSIQELWEKELDSSSSVADVTAANSSIWYSRAFNYWESEENCPITDDGVLGGYGALTPMDVKGSNAFLDRLSAARPELRFDVAADCGAGIGRVSKNLLLHRFARVDLIEQSPRLTNAAPTYIGADSSRAVYICLGLQVGFCVRHNENTCARHDYVLWSLHPRTIIVAVAHDERLYMLSLHFFLFFIRGCFRTLNQSQTVTMLYGYNG